MAVKIRDTGDRCAPMHFVRSKNDVLAMTPIDAWNEGYSAALFVTTGQATRVDRRPSLCDDPKGWARVGEGVGFPMVPKTAAPLWRRTGRCESTPPRSTV